VSGTFVGTLTVQGVDLGSTTLTASATGYNSATTTATVDPSGFIINSPGSITTTTLASNTTVQITPARLNAMTLNFAANQSIRAGQSINVTVTSSNTAVGTITTSPLSFTGNTSFINTAFDPVAEGTSVITVDVPSGFSTPSNFRTITATVTAPDVTISSSVTVGKDLQQSLSVNLQNAPPSPVDVTITVTNPAIAIVSSSATAAGGNSITFTGVSGTFVGTIYIQGLTIGSTTFTASASGYNSGSGTVTVDPSGFIINSPGSITTTAAASNTTIQITPARLNSTTLNFAANQPLRGGLSVDVSVTSSNTSVGTITTSPLTFTGNTTAVNTAFDPLAAGTSTITVGTPSGFSTPSNFRQITATVNP
jgi:hypothetical protein